MTKQKLDFGVRPKCVNAECNADAQYKGYINKNGKPSFRKYCTKCHQIDVAQRNGLSAVEWRASFHQYKKFRKNYCENAIGEFKGWLGFVCTTNVVVPHLMLDTDHIDGNPSNNTEDNLMTLCKCCHAIKTRMFLDYQTPGRKYFTGLMEN